MGRLRSWLRRMERETSGGLVRIPQADGTVFAIDRMQAHVECFLYLYNSMLADANAVERPEPPSTLLAGAGAKDRASALAKVLDGYKSLPVDPEALIEFGEFVPVSTVAGYTYEQVMERGPILDLSDQAKAERGEEC